MLVVEANSSNEILIDPTFNVYLNNIYPFGGNRGKLFELKSNSFPIGGFYGIKHTWFYLGSASVPFKRTFLIYLGSIYLYLCSLYIGAHF